jgi:hypothetical protein
MTFSMPSSFPQETFQEFGKQASKLFPAVLTDKNLNDPLQKQQHFERAWLAIRYRYRACYEQNEEFKALLQHTTDLWREWGSDEEKNYRLEQCLYYFFMNCLSVFDSFAFCLYFVGAMIVPEHFSHVGKPKNITLKATTNAFASAFPNEPITKRLRILSEDTDFKRVKLVRNILAHRLAGRRNVHSFGTTDADGTYTQTREEIWYIPGSNEKPEFSEKLTQHHFEGVNRLLTTLFLVSIEFVKLEKRE